MIRDDKNTDVDAEGILYAKAPIVEAVIDLQFRFPTNRSFELSEKAIAPFVATFPERQAVHLLEIGVDTDGAGALTSKSQTKKQIGWKFLNETQDRILQIQSQAFTYSHLPQYTRWKNFRDEAKPLWSKFVGAFRPERVVRVAVRYINRLRLPGDPFELSDYLNFYPQTMPAMEPIAGLLTRVQTANPQIDAKSASIVTLASEPRVDQSFQPMVLDFDVYCMTDFSPDSNEIWELLEKLRERKNQLFEAAITNLMKEQIK